jgi:SAM-dependent methyltransferase
LLRSSGRDLALFKDASFDLVYAVDTFPYLVLSGRDLAERHMSDAARVLRPGGTLLVLNYSYLGDLERTGRISLLRRAQPAWKWCVTARGISRLGCGDLPNGPGALIVRFSRLRNCNMG